MADGGIGATVITFGKCAGLTFEQVRASDPEYCRWVLSLPRPTGAIVAFCDYLQQRQVPPSAPASPPRPLAGSQPQTSSPSTPAKRARAEGADRASAVKRSPSRTSPTPAQSSSTVLSQSKYKGKTYGWILRHQPGFCRWALGRSLKTQPMRDFQRWLKQHAVAEADEGRYDLVGAREGDETYDDEDGSDEFDDGSDDDDTHPAQHAGVHGSRSGMGGGSGGAAGGGRGGGGPTPVHIAPRASPARGPAAGSSRRPGPSSPVIDLVAPPPPPSRARERGAREVVIDLVHAAASGPTSSAARAHAATTGVAGATGSSSALPRKSSAPARGATTTQRTDAAAVEELERVRAELAALRACQEAALEEKLCGICMEGEKGVAFQCGHRVCKECSPKVSDCPYCKKRITKRINLY